MTALQHTRKHLPVITLAAAVALAGTWMPRTASASEPAFQNAQHGAQALVSPFDATKAGGNGNGNGNGGGGNGGGGNGGGGNGGGGGKPGGALAVELQPDVWNTNYDHNSTGTVSALIRGEGLGDIDLDSIVLVGTDDAEEGVPALRVMRQGKQIRAFFAKDDAISSLDTPAPGEVHEVTIEFTMGEDDTETSLTDRVRIVGPAAAAVAVAMTSWISTWPSRLIAGTSTGHAATAP